MGPGALTTPTLLPAVQEDAVGTIIDVLASGQWDSIDPAKLLASLQNGNDVGSEVTQNPVAAIVLAQRAGRLVHAEQLRSDLLKKLLHLNPHHPIATRFSTDAGMAISKILRRPLALLEREMVLAKQNTNYQGTFPVHIVTDRADLDLLKKQERPWKFVIVELPGGVPEIRIAEGGKHHSMVIKPEKMIATGQIRIQDGIIQLSGEGELYQTADGKITLAKQKSGIDLSRFAHPMAEHAGLKTAKELFQRVAGEETPITTSAKGFRQNPKPEELEKREAQLTQQWEAPVAIVQSREEALEFSDQHPPKTKYFWVVVSSHGNLEFRLAQAKEGKKPEDLILTSERELGHGEGLFGIQEGERIFTLSGCHEETWFDRFAKGAKTIGEVVASFLKPANIATAGNGSATAASRYDISDFDTLVSRMKEQNELRYIYVKDNSEVFHFRVAPKNELPENMIFIRDTIISSGTISRKKGQWEKSVYVLDNDDEHYKTLSGGLREAVQFLNALKNKMSLATRPEIFILTQVQWESHSLNPRTGYRGTGTR